MQRAFVLINCDLGSEASLIKELNQLESAIKNYDKAIKLKPDYYEAYNNLGLIQLELKNTNVAIT